MVKHAHVGRVGGLAIALGVGTALFTGLGAGAAWADEGSTGGEASSAESSASSEQTSSEPAVTTDVDAGDGADGGAGGVSSSSARPTSVVGNGRTPGVETEDDDAAEPVAVKAPETVEPEPVVAVRESDDSPVDVEPSSPVEVPAVFSVLGAARRESAESVVAQSTAEASAVETEAVETAAVTSAPVTTPEELAELAVPVDDSEFTGTPSLINQVFVTVLRLTQPILSAFGISLNGSTASIPFITDGRPPFFLTFGMRATSEDYAFDDGTTWKVWTLAPGDPAQTTEKVVIGLHGGSFITTASIFHWLTYTDIVRATGATVIVPMYPLAKADGTGGTAATVVPKTAEFFRDASALHGGENVSVLGDSAGGSIALAALQLAVAQCAAAVACDPAADLPGRLVLFSPSLDSGLTNPYADSVDDPILDPAASRRNGALWAAGLDGGTANPLASPIYGSMAGLPPTTVFAGSEELRAPDVLVLRELAERTPGADFTFDLRLGQVHDWVLFAFLPDAQEIRPAVYDSLGL